MTGRLLRRLALLVTLPALLFAAWWIASAGSTTYYLPSLQTILGSFGRVWTGERFRADVFPSLWRLAAGYAVAFVLALGLGVVIGSHRRMRAVLEPVLEFFRAIPPPVLVPVIMLFAGIGNTMKVLVIAFGCLWPILLNTVEGVRAVDGVLVDTCRSYHIRGLSRLRYFVLPAASPQIFAGLRQALSVGIILMVISEMTAASEGLGFDIVQFQRSFAIPDMWTGILLLGLIGLVLSLIFQLVESRVLAWYHGLRRAQRAS